jgi:hypothetical protein
MTLYRGNATIAGQYVVIQPPQGFGAINGLRLTNYTGMTLLLNNMSSTGQGEEFLFPQQQMVYHTRNISAFPTAQGFYTHKAFSPNQIFVEWSDDSINDFIGTYPAFLPQPTLANPTILGSPVILTVNAPMTIAAPPPINESVLTNTVNSVQAPGPLTIPVGFEFDLTGLQITATYSGAIGVAVFNIALGAATGAVVTNIWAQANFVLQKTALADNPTSTQILNYPQGSVVIPAGAIPVFIYLTGPAGVTFTASTTGVLLPTS